MGFFTKLKQAREARRKRVEEFNRKHYGKQTTIVAKPVEEQPVVEERSPTPAVSKAESMGQSSVPERTLQDKVNSMMDNVVNPENHPEPVPAVKSVPSDEPTDEDDEESQDDDDKDLTDLPTATTGVPDVRSDESKVVETISPPLSIKPMDKETMEKFHEEQRAQQNAGFLCGCI